MHRAIIYGSVLSPLIPLFILQTRSGPLRLLDRVIVLYVTISFLFDLVSVLLAFSGIKTYPLIHLFAFLEFALLTFYFYRLLNWNRSFLIGLLACYTVVYSVNSFRFELYEEFNPIIRSITSLICITFVLLFLIRLFKRETEIFIESSPDFWFNLAILTYFSIAFFSFMLSTDILSKPINNLLYSWIFHNIANILKNILFAIGLWKIRVAT